MYKGRKGKVFIVDITDIIMMCSKPEKLIMKHISEDELTSTISLCELVILQ